MSHIVYARDAAREDRHEVLLEAIQSIQLAALVTAVPDGGLKVTHLPLVAVNDGEGNTMLKGHLARANDHWKIIEQATARSAVIFQGPHTYMSPSNYASKQETAKVVPTWTYIIVHAHGHAATHHDADWLLAHTSDLTDHNEGKRDKPWKVSDAPDDYVASMLRGIVGLEIRVDQLEGVWKLNQHRSEADKASMVSGLSSSKSASDQQIGAIMEKTFNDSF